MTPVYYADRNKGRMREFKLTPRRRQIMCHIAYDDGVYTALKTNFSTWSPASVPRFHLAGTRPRDRYPAEAVQASRL